MKHLLEYFFESIKTKQDTLVDFIKKTNDEDVIDTLYNTYKKLHKDGDSEDSYFKAIGKLIDQKMEGRKAGHIKSFKESIYGSCEKYNCYEAIGIIAKKQLAKDKDAFIKIDFGKENPSINMNYIGEYYNNYLSKINEDIKIPDNFWFSLFKKEGATQPVMGKGEFLLVYISEFPEGDVKGDVVIDGHSVEVKNLTSAEAKLGNAEKGNDEPIFNLMNHIKELNKVDVDKITPSDISKSATGAKGKKLIADLKTIIDSITNENKEDLIKFLKKEINDNFYFHDSKTVKDEFNAIESTIDYLIDLKNENEKNFGKQFIKIFTALYVILYCISENANYLCMVDPQKNFNFVLIDKDSFKRIMNDDKFPIYKIRHSSGINLILIKY